MGGGGGGGQAFPSFRLGAMSRKWVIRLYEDDGESELGDEKEAKM